MKRTTLLASAAAAASAVGAGRLRRRHAQQSTGDSAVEKQRSAAELKRRLDQARMRLKASIKSPDE